ncbi:MAG: RNA polymerase sigma factor [Phycisphaerales bacterium]
MTGHSSVVTDDCTDLAALAAGDRRAFDRLYDRHAAVVLSFCRRGAGASAADCEDAMQETFIRAHDRLSAVEDCRGFRKWLLQIASFVTRERRRSAGRYSRRLRLVAQESAPETAPDAAAPETRAAHAEELTRLGSALDQLPDDERLAIHIQYLEHDPVTAAAGALGLSRSAYYKLLARARAHLAQLMQQEVTA